jgi:5S rRNA maturation endonuclease (ribonuclease M5)
VRGVSEKNTRLAHEVEEIENILKMLKEKTSRGIPVIVEGRKDTEALNRLDVSGSILEIKSSKKSIFNRLESDITDEEIVIFTDFDRRGSELARDIQSHLERRGKKGNILLWRKMRNLIGKKVKDIEGIPSYILTLKRLSSKPSSYTN